LSVDIGEGPTPERPVVGQISIGVDGSTAPSDSWAALDGFARYHPRSARRGGSRAISTTALGHGAAERGAIAG
jgi:hypothetical protein